MASSLIERPVDILDATVPGYLRLPDAPQGIVVYSGDDDDPHDDAVAEEAAVVLDGRAIGFLRVPLMSPRERLVHHAGAVLDIKRLALHLMAVTDWAVGQADLGDLSLGYLGVGAGGAPALIAAGDMGTRVRALVVERGHPDLANHDLSKVTAPTLLVTGEVDWPRVTESIDAFHMLRCQRALHAVPSVGNVFADPDSRGHVLSVAADWFQKHL